MAKINVSIPDDLLREVDAMAEAIHRSRSGLIQDATTEYVTRLRNAQDREDRRSSIEEAMAAARVLAGRVPPGDDTTTIIRRERDTGQRNEVTHG